MAPTDLTHPKVEELLKKSISLLESLKDESVAEDLALYYGILGTLLANQGDLNSPWGMVAVCFKIQDGFMLIQ